MTDPQSSRDKLQEVNPIRGGFTVVDKYEGRDEHGCVSYKMFDIDAYPVLEKGFGIESACGEWLDKTKGRVREAWTVLENYDCPVGCSMTVGSGWVEFDDGSTEFFSSDRYDISSIEWFPKLAYRNPKTEYEEMSLL